MSSEYQPSDAEMESSGGGLAVTDVYYVLFRRKWVVLAGVVFGVAAACGLWKLRQPLFKSEAKLLVKYVVEPQVILATGTPVNVQHPDESGAGILTSEIEILQSVDNLQEVARAVTPGRILPKGANPNDVDRAAGMILKKLKAVPLPRSKIILLEFQHAKAEVAQQVLREVIKSYLKKHDYVHRALGVSDASLLERRDELKTNFMAIVDRLKVLKDQAGVHSLEEGKSAKTKHENGIRESLFTANGRLAELRASLNELLQQGATSGVPATTSEFVPPDKIREYRSLVEQITALNRRLAEQAGLTAAAPQKATNLVLLQEAQLQQSKLESEWPGLLRLTSTPLPLALLSPPTLTPTMNASTLKVEIKALESKTAELTNQLAMIRNELKSIENVEAETADLERRKAAVEKEMAVVEQGIYQASLNSNLRDRQNTSISPFQEPSPPYKDYGRLLKKMIMAVAGGLIGGLVLAFVVELVLARTIKRPKDVEGILQLPLFLSIPVLRMRSRRLVVGGNGKPSGPDGARPDPGGKGSSSGAVIKAPPPQQESEMKSYHDALRDRLVTYFDVRDMTHKPKLIAVTGCSPGSGVSSVATGLAASLSETGDGNVLLVDMKGQKGAAHAFFQGKPACGLDEALANETRNSAQVDDKLYVVAAGSVDQKLQRIIPQQFSQFVPKLKASDYDYIIFDMPPVAQTSITAKVARFMDMVLMVVEAERTDRDVAKRATTLLTESKASVAAVLNKRRRYVPSWLLEEFH
jgi:uncharacterized protein involved in exopolysaccharide biosynthesis/Mrp family chromosome partitioning ATPase